MCAHSVRHNKRMLYDDQFTVDVMKIVNGLPHMLTRDLFAIAKLTFLLITYISEIVLPILSKFATFVPANKLLIKVAISIINSDIVTS